ncbi:MAG: lipopolysaccharide biosynthesis protein [Ruminococcaceae bacterium]|nr:lipopolysaccharide biosynthesis protein [Oscillospiraceae bacterium]
MTNILFCGNSGVFDGVICCALSILKRTASKEPFCFYLFTMDVSHLKESYTPIDDRQVAFLREIVREYNPENRVIKVDVTELYMNEFSGCPNEGAYCSPYTLIRLFADKVSEIPDKILYLDVDIMFNRDISLLYDTDVEGYEYAAARDHYGKYLISPNYINAGVLLLNMKEIRKSGLLARARELIKTKKLTFADQSAIIRSTTKKKMLPQRFNDQKFLHSHTVVRHFSKRLFWLPYPHTDNVKQWQVSRVHKIFGYYCFDDILYEYIYLIKRYQKED